MGDLLSVKQLYDSINGVPGRNITFSPNQKQIIEFGTGPLWIIAGPGSGKTESLVLRCLKLLFVDGIKPRSIMITTFTEKAGQNLKDRLINYKAFISKQYPQINKIDLFQLRVGTLHSLCNSIMLEYRYPGYKNYRLLDDLDQLLFIFFHSSLVRKGGKGKNKLSPDETEFWNHFKFAWNKVHWRSKFYENRLPSKWIRARTLQALFNRIVEDMLDLEKMKKHRRPEWKILVKAFEEYAALLEENYRVDFAHIQKKFLNFLDHELGKKFVEEDDDISSRLSQVLVDEYQDTNPIQEEIYLKLCRQPPHNVTVVGDDDQALYRFRGGTVECMVNFGKTIKDRFNIKTQSIELIENYRSHGRIVNWCNEYITSFDAMIKPGARSPDKSKLIPKSKINGNYPAVSLISGESNDEVADKFASLVKNLMENRIVNDPSDCVLLMRSTRYSRYYAAPFMDALSNKQIMVFNPRARNYLGQEEIRIALGAFLEIVDQNPDELVLSRDTKFSCNKWRDAYKELVEDHRYAKLKKYVDKSIQIISTLRQDQRLQSTMQDILYHILNHEPFIGWLEDPEKTFRLGELTRLFEAYSSSPVPGYPGLMRGDLKGSGERQGQISWQWRNTFYNSFITLVLEEGLNDPEDDEEIVPRGYLPIMTVHQAKGLEFPFVFVAGLDSRDDPDRYGISSSGAKCN